MVKHLTKNGECGRCGYRISREDKDRTEVVFLAIKSMRISKVDGSVTGVCPRCKIELTLPVIRVKKTEMSKFNVRIFTKKNT